MIRLEKTPEGNYICPDDPGEPGYEGNPPRRSVTDEECGILKALAFRRYVLEVGTGLGVSTRAMAEMARRVVTVDTDPWVIGLDLDLPSSVFRMDQIVWTDRGFDLAFIDGHHDFDAVTNDLAGVISTCDDPLIVLHDTNIPGVMAAAEDFGLVKLCDFGGPCAMAAFRAP